MIKSNFRDWNLEKIETIFGLVQVEKLSVLDEWLAIPYECDAYEQRYLLGLQKNYTRFGGDDWNEIELENKFISPLIVFAELDNRNFAYFLEREMQAIIGDYDLSGRVDGMIATGFRSPKKPYFCMKEYKRQTDPDGDPRGQALIAMMVAQQKNDNQNPIFGAYIIGRNWHFMALMGNEYALSNDYSCVDDEIFDIFRIIKGLKKLIEKMLSLPQPLPRRGV
jgi:hypothetical protein